MNPTRTIGSLLILSLLALGACSTSPDGSDFGSVVVTATTTGEDLDPDGYTVTLGTDVRPVGINGSVTFSDLETDIYAVTIGDVADNCEVSGSATRSAPVVLGPPVEIDYEVVCVAIT